MAYRVSHRIPARAPGYPGGAFIVQDPGTGLARTAVCLQPRLPLLYGAWEVHDTFTTAAVTLPEEKNAVLDAVLARVQGDPGDEGLVPGLCAAIAGETYWAAHPGDDVAHTAQLACGCFIQASENTTRENGSQGLGHCPAHRWQPVVSVSPALDGRG